jgi:hypothetical protein
MNKREILGPAGVKETLLKGRKQMLRHAVAAISRRSENVIVMDDRDSCLCGNDLIRHCFFLFPVSRFSKTPVKSREARQFCQAFFVRSLLINL